MNVKKAVTTLITIGDQPTEADLRSLKGEGFVGVINLRNDGEPEQPIGTAAEGELARSVGLDYLHYGVGSAPLTESGIADVCQFLEGHASGKTLVHCRKGGRAAAIVLIRQALAEGWPADEAVERGASMGLTVDGGLRNLVETYLKQHPPEVR